MPRYFPSLDEEVQGQMAAQSRQQRTQDNAGVIAANSRNFDSFVRLARFFPNFRPGVIRALSQAGLDENHPVTKYAARQTFSMQDRNSSLQYRLGERMRAGSLLPGQYSMAVQSEEEKLARAEMRRITDQTRGGPGSDQANAEAEAYAAFAEFERQGATITELRGKGFLPITTLIHTSEGRQLIDHARSTGVIDGAGNLREPSEDDIINHRLFEALVDKAEEESPDKTVAHISNEGRLFHSKPPFRGSTGRRREELNVEDVTGIEPFRMGGSGGAGGGNLPALSLNRTQRSVQAGMGDVAGEAFNQTMAGANAPIQELTGLLRAGYGAATGRGFHPQSQSDLGIMLANKNMSREEVVEERLRRESQYGQIGGHNLSVGRVIANIVAEPDTVPFDLISGAADATMQIAADPTTYVMGGAAKLTALRNTFVSEAEDQARRNAGGFGNAIFKWVNRPTANRFLDDPATMPFLQDMVDTTSAYRIGGKLGFRTAPAVERRLAQATDIDQVKDVFRGALGTQIQSKSDLMAGMGAIGAQPSQFNLTYRSSPLARRMPARRMDTYNQRESANELVMSLHNAKVEESIIEEVYNDAINASSRVDLHDIGYRAIHEINSSVESKGFKVPRFADKLTQTHKTGMSLMYDDFVDEISSNTPTMKGLMINGEVEDIPSAHLLSEYVARYIDMPDPRAVRRLVSPAVGTVTARGRQLPGQPAVMRAISKLSDRAVPKEYQELTGELRWPLYAMEQATNFLWKPIVLARAAWALRVGMTEQARIASDSGTFFPHPFSAFQFIVGRKGGPLGDDLAAESEAFLGALSKNNGQTGLSAGVSGWIDSPSTSRATETFVASKAGDNSDRWGEALAFNMAQLRRDPIAMHIVDPARNSLDETVDWMMVGAGRAHRERMVASGNTLTDSVQTRAYVERVEQRIHTITGNGNPELVDALRTGTLNGRSMLRFTEPSRRFIRDMENYRNLPNTPDKLVGMAPKLDGPHNLREVYDRSMGFVLNALGSAPSNKLQRSPAFRRSAWRHTENLMGHADEATQDTVIANARQMRLPKSQIKRLERLKSYGNGPLNAEEFDEIIKAHALEDTNDLLYNLAQRGRTMDMLRVIFPFGEAYKEELTVWARQIKEQYGRPLRRAQQIIQGAQGEDLGEFLVDIGAYPELDNVDYNGFFMKNAYGDTVFAFPWSHAINNLPIPGFPHAPIPLTARAAGLSLVTDIIPGLGPVAQLPVAYLNDKLAQHFPDIAAEMNDTIFKYGDPAFDLQGIARQSMPAWMRPLMDRYDVLGLRDERTYANSTKDAAAYLMSTGGYGTDRAEQNRMLEDATKIANRLYIVEFLGKFTMPSSPNAEAVMEDKDGKLIALAAYTQEYFDHLEDEPETAAQTMLDKYGPNTYLALQPKSTSEVELLPTTQDQENWVMQHGGVVEIMPNTYGVFMPQGGEFDHDVYIRQFLGEEVGHGGRHPLEAKQWLRLANDLRGRGIYQQMKDQIPEGENPTDEDRLWLREWREYLEGEYEGFNDTSGTLERATTAEKIDEVTAAFDRNSPVRRTLMRTPAGKAINEYLGRRQSILDDISESNHSLGMNETLRASAWADSRSWLTEWGEYMSERTPEFKPAWETIFSRELRVE